MPLAALLPVPVTFDFFGFTQVYTSADAPAFDDEEENEEEDDDEEEEV